MDGHKLSLTIAGATASGSVAVLLVADLLFGWFPFWGMLLLTAALGGVAYAAARHYLAERLKTVHRMLRRIREQQFNVLDDAPLEDGDELHALIRQVHRTGRSLEEEIQKLKRLEDYRREYIGNVSHELKTPIFTIQGSAETLLNGALDDPNANRSFVEKIHRNAARLDNLARDLSEISRIETGELQMTIEPFCLDDLVDEVIETLAPLAENKRISLRRELPSELPPVKGDRDRLRQVLVNLVDNAIKYNDAGGFVEIVARELPGDEVKISVADDGIGIDAEHVPRLTERFYRVDKSRSRAQGGTGLGLAIVKHILSVHDRTLQVESTPGSGSTFGFTLPAAE